MWGTGRRAGEANVTEGLGVDPPYSSYRGLTVSRRVTQALRRVPVCPLLNPLAGGGSTEKRLRGCYYSVIVITVELL